MARNRSTIGPKELGPEGKKLWKHLADQFDIGSAEPLLLMLCSVQDRLVEVRAAITASGVVLVDGKKNPLLATEAQLMAEFVKIWKTLGLADLPSEEKRSPGRPPESDRVPSSGLPQRIRR